MKVLLNDPDESQPGEELLKPEDGVGVRIDETQHQRFNFGFEQNARINARVNPFHTAIVPYFLLRLLVFLEEKVHFR